MTRLLRVLLFWGAAYTVGTALGHVIHRIDQLQET